MAVEEKLKFTKNWITSKRFVLYAPNLVCIIHFAPETSLWSLNVEIHNRRGPKAAILKFAKARLTPEAFVRFSQNLAQSCVLAPHRHRKYQYRHFSKSKMAAEEKVKFIKNWITSKRFVRFEPDFVFSINSALATRVWSHNHENRNPRWPMAAMLKFTIFQ